MFQSPHRPPTPQHITISQPKGSSPTILSFSKAAISSTMAWTWTMRMIIKTWPVAPRRALRPSHSHLRCHWQRLSKARVKRRKEAEWLTSRHGTLRTGSISSPLTTSPCKLMISRIYQNKKPVLTSSFVVRPCVRLVPSLLLKWKPTKAFITPLLMRPLFVRRRITFK